MKHSITIAHNVFREAIRDRVLYVIFFFAVLFIGSTWFLAELSMREETKIIYDLGLAAIALFAIVITIFLSSSLLFKETDKGTVYVILSKPISRTAFIIGKWLGTAITVAILILLMSGIFASVVAIHGDPLPNGFVLSLILLAMEVLFIAATALFFSSFTSPLITTVATLIVTIVGHLMQDIRTLAAAADTSEVLKKVTAGLSYVMPNLDTLNIRDQIAHGIVVSPDQFISTLLYISAYIVGLLVLACSIFNTKDF